jgi:ABC-2 type transport system permease protein
MRTCGAIAWRELRALLRDKAFLAIAITVPLIYALLFGGVYWNKKLTEIPVTIVDQDNSHLSREITGAISASETFKTGLYSDSVDEFRIQAQTGRSHVCFVFPYHFERDVKAGRKAKVAVWVDASNILVGNVAITSASEIIGAYSAGVDIRKSEMRGMADSSAPLWVVQPISDNYRILYNPALNGNYTNFMLMGLVTIAIQLLTLLMIARSGAREIEENTITELQGMTRSPSAIILGKCMVYFALMFPASVIALHIPCLLVGVPMAGSELLLLGMTAWFLFILILAGMGVSSLLRDSLQTTEAFAIVAMPSFLASGFSWPSFAMPAAMKAASYAFPLSPYAMSVRKITMMGDSAHYLGSELIAFGVWSVVAIALAYLGAYRLLRFQEVR